jgi:hypothetical protein
MKVWRAYELWETLSDNELERLEQGLRGEVERYSFIIQNSPPDRSEKIEGPYLAAIQAKLDDVCHLRAGRRKTSN